uniref:DDRGK domain-containing protein 1 n=1 Tax=Erythrolobus madagascarensis TaxID=708628 RepID=A0A7S0T6G5_9RHOD|mmetsp:Transcript_4212/g.9200  ORF Transcript_4212/g.9200 Transcript_4212/m.9200 type:complete len:256 (+) Transcript_4212:48-815(+)
MMDWSLVPLVLVFGAMVAISVVLFRMRSNAEKESADEDAMRRAVEIAAARATQERSNPRRAQTASRMRRRAPGVAAASSSSSGGASQLDGAAAGDDGEDVAGAAPPGRISKKKELNKEAKRAAKAAREAAIEAQRERDAARAERAAEKEEEERRLEQEAETRQKKEEEERAKKEQEEYDQWKNLISVENTGDQEEELATESQGLLAEFVEFIKQEKVVVLEELAARFNLRTEDAVNRVQVSCDTKQLVSNQRRNL